MASTIPSFQAKLDHTLSVVESGLNIGGYVPIVSSVSGAARIAIGKLEVVAAVVAAVFMFVKAHFLSGPEREQTLDKAMEFLSYATHGFANIFRGAIETLPLVSLVTCLPYDLLGHRYKYPTEPAAVGEGAPAPATAR